MSLATRAPPATASEPPSQKSFWTSTTRSPRVMLPRYPAAPRVTEPGWGSQVNGRDDRFASRHLPGGHPPLAARGQMPRASLVERLPTDGWPAGHQRDEQRPVAAVVDGGRADADSSPSRAAVGRPRA